MLAPRRCRKRSRRHANGVGARRRDGGRCREGRRAAGNFDAVTARRADGRSDVECRRSRSGCRLSSKRTPSPAPCATIVAEVPLKVTVPACALVAETRKPSPEPAAVRLVVPPNVAAPASTKDGVAGRADIDAEAGRRVERSDAIRRRRGCQVDAVRGAACGRDRGGVVEVDGAAVHAHAHGARTASRDHDGFTEVRCSAVGIDADAPERCRTTGLLNRVVADRARSAARCDVHRSVEIVRALDRVIVNADARRSACRDVGRPADGDRRPRHRRQCRSRRKQRCSKVHSRLPPAEYRR